MTQSANKPSASSTARLQRLCFCGVMIALAAIFSYIEGLFPISLGAPGVKLGLANIVVLFALYRYGAGAAAAISLLRIALVAAMFGNITAALYSMAGATVSLAVMLLLRRTGRFSLPGVSMAGGVSHPAAQLAVAMLITRTPTLLSYLPVIIIAGMVAGLLMGLLAHQVLQRISPAFGSQPMVGSSTSKSED